MLGSQLRARILISGLWLTLCAPVAWWASSALTYRYVDRQLADVKHQELNRLHELSSQVVDTLDRLDSISHSNKGTTECTSEIFRLQAQVIRQWRYVNEAAVRLDSGMVCHSFGAQESAIVLPSDGASNHYTAGSSRAYWFDAGPGVSADTGTVVIAQDNSYLWLNKGILVDMLASPQAPTLSLDLIDEHSLQSLFSNDIASIPLSKRPALYELTFGDERVYIAYPVKWTGMFALLSLPISTYYLVWLILFTGLLIASLIILVTLCRLTRLIYEYRFSLLAKLRKALKKNQLKVHYQPIVDIQTGRWKGAEALLRWTHDGKAVTPHVFIPLAEKGRIIRQLTRWVCKQVVEDERTYLWAWNDLYITINLSAHDVTDSDFPDFVEALLRTHGIPATRIVFEVTERSLIGTAPIQLQRLRDMGHRIAIDDFGINYFSLSCLGELPVDILKLDRSFLNPEKLYSNNSNLWCLTCLAHSHNLTVVAEGLETFEQIQAVKFAGIPLAQGWYYSHDLPIEQLAKGFFSITEPFVDSRAASRMPNTCQPGYPL